MNFYQVISRKQINDNILIFHEIINKFQTTTLNLVKNSKLLSHLAKNAFNISFINKDVKSVFENVCEKNREKIKERNKKKLKINKKSIKIVNLSEQKYIFKKIVLSFRNHF